MTNMTIDHAMTELPRPRFRPGHAIVRLALASAYLWALAHGVQALASLL